MLFEPQPDITVFELARITACYASGDFTPVLGNSELSRHFSLRGYSLDWIMGGGYETDIQYGTCGTENNAGQIQK
ncbi:MAG: hypothetical protein GY710_01585 [Desulfobacteraceae bacterium]|nr:hypothetical protein [Desulfobacteraceae bacterium]